MRRVAPLVAAAVGLLAAAGPSNAYVLAGRPWPKSTIAYYTAATSYSPSVDRAARMINRANVGIHLRAATRKNADVIIAYGGNPCEDSALVGFQRRLTDVLYIGAGCSSGLATLTAVHEFGHVLGLGHEPRRCARMNATFDGSGTPGHCAERSLNYWLAHPLLADDLRGLRLQYR
jgi:hypothetical protein